MSKPFAVCALYVVFMGRVGPIQEEVIVVIYTNKLEIRTFFWQAFREKHWADLIDKKILFHIL
jgi:hypothetical protein